MARAVQYNPESGRDYFSNVRFQPDDAAKLISMAEASRLTVRDTLVMLVRAAPIDSHGRAVPVEEQLAAEAARKEEDSPLF